MSLFQQGSKLIAVITVVPAGKTSFVQGYMYEAYGSTDKITAMLTVYCPLYRGGLREFMR